MKSMFVIMKNSKQFSKKKISLISFTLPVLRVSRNQSLNHNYTLITMSVVARSYLDSWMNSK